MNGQAQTVTFRKLLRRLAFWQTLIITVLFTLMRNTRNDYQDTLHIATDFLVLFTYSLFIWWFSLWFDGYEKQIARVAADSNRGLAVQIATTFVLGILLVVGIESLVYSTVHEEKAPIGYFVFRGIIVNAIIQGLFYSLKAVYKNRQMEVENAALREQNTQAQLDLLRQQVSPHFLFNSLNTLTGLVKAGDPEAGNFIVHLSDVYRYLLQGSRLNKVSLQEELQMLHAYAYLLKARFRDNFSLAIDLPGSLMQSSIPPLTLQILLENCIKHNVVSSSNHLHVTITTAEDGRQIIVRNNLQPKRAVGTSTQLGLANINHRYHLLGGQQITIQKNDRQFAVHLPVLI